MARVNINILGISELKWTRMGEFNSDDHYIYYRRWESLWRSGVALIVNKRIQNAVLGCNLKNDRMISVHFQGKPFDFIIIQICAPTTDAEEAGFHRFYEDLLELTPKIDLFVMSVCSVGLLCWWKRMFAMTSVFSLRNSVSLCPLSFCTPRPNLPVTLGISLLPTLHSSPNQP